MSMSDEHIDRRLHRLHDGDLDESERAAIEKEIAADPALAAKLEGLREVGVVVRAARTDDAPIDGDAMWKAVETKITTPARPPLRAIEGGATKPIEDPRAQRRRYVGIAVGVLAIAAAAMLVIYDSQRSGEDTVAVAPPAPSTAIEEPAPPPPDYTEVLAVDFGTNVGTIFSVEGESGQRYAVVWLDDVLKHDEDPASAPVETDVPVAPN
jgi:anti-sigma factor RsiW